MTPARPGDRFQPQGSAAPRRPLPFLATRGVPRLDRDRHPVERDASNRIARVVGAAAAEFARCRGLASTAITCRLT